MAAKRSAKITDNLDPLGLGMAEVDEGVRLMHMEGVGAVFLPRSVLRLRPEQMVDVVEIQQLALSIRDAQRALDEAVESARDQGVSWAAIGWSVGTTGEAARQRWGVDRG